MNDATRQPRIEVIPPGQGPPVDGVAGPHAVQRRPRTAQPRSKFKALAARVPGVNTVMALWLFMMDDEAPAKFRLSILGSLLYFVLPKDLLPDFFLPFGVLDDAAIFFGLVAFIGSETLAPYRAQARKLLREG